MQSLKIYILVVLFINNFQTFLILKAEILWPVTGGIFSHKQKTCGLFSFYYIEYQNQEIIQ